MVLICTLLTACQQDAAEQRAEFLVFGTVVKVVVRDLPESRAEMVFGRLGRDFQRMHHEWHPWESGALTDLNRALSEGTVVRTTADLATLIETSQELEARSGGLFNPAIGALVRLWGFHTSRYPITDPPPESAEIEALLFHRPSTLALEVHDRQVHTSNRAVQLDFSGIAKGLAALRACGRLAEFQVPDAMIDLGGDVMICSRTDRPWRVAISDGRRGVLTTIEVAERMALFTSGNYHRYGEWGGERYAHILDPTTGRPVDRIMQATVIDPDPLLADAAATALVVAGPAIWEVVADDLQVDKVVIIDSDGNVQVSDAVRSLMPENHQSRPTALNAPGRVQSAE